MNSDISFKKIPSVNILLNEISGLYRNIHPDYLKRIIVMYLELVRRYPGKYQLNKMDKDGFKKHIVHQISNELDNLLSGSLKKVINATGVVLHTGLGRAPLDEKVTHSLEEIVRYSNLEINMNTGKRGDRLDHISKLICILTGAEDGIACNNNAAAVMLMLNSVANHKEVILSRGEMIEIGGSFRLPEVMKSSGCRLREVGTTNRTHLSDYENAISKKTGAILICHTSNYEIKGFTSSPPVEDIVALAEKYHLPLLYDLGSGSLTSTDTIGSAASEPEVNEIIRKNVDLVSFSGDKLLGGPQSGMIAGKREWVKKCRKNHLLRALRLDKVIIKLLQQTLILYLTSGKNGRPDLDTMNALTASSQIMKKRSENFIKSLPEDLEADIKIIKAKGKVGSGAFPNLELDSYAIQIKPGTLKTEQLGKKLRSFRTPIVSYIAEDTLLLDLRCVSEEEEKLIIKALRKILASEKSIHS